MAEQPHILDDDADGELTKLVSYLDGELEDVEMHAVERRLIEDPDLRSHADILSRTWAMLDELEEVSASQKFTQDTVATVSMEAAKSPADADASPLRKFFGWSARYRVLPLFLLGIVGGLTGLWLAEQATERRDAQGTGAANRLLLDHYDLIRNAEVYSAVPDVAELRKLNLPTDPEADPQDNLPGRAAEASDE